MAFHRSNGKNRKSQWGAAPACGGGATAVLRTRGKDAVESVRSPLRVLNPVMMHSWVFFANLAESLLKFRQGGFSGAFRRGRFAKS
jgi:hypothetical protein